MSCVKRFANWQLPFSFNLVQADCCDNNVSGALKLHLDVATQDAKTSVTLSMQQLLHLVPQLSSRCKRYRQKLTTLTHRSNRCTAKRKILHATYSLWGVETNMSWGQCCQAWGQKLQDLHDKVVTVQYIYVYTCIDITMVLGFVTM